ncbi:helix-turn-helix transcriptional regulator [Micromonospora okii]|uniref:helix-turn-helix transcriptional regulator n=1 Tax=Micromonospora okii TaxID=1182970 RepID=UPI001E2A7CA9|nr:AraC family transcriptional regulator [Micromonospora okii]
MVPSGPLSPATRSDLVTPPTAATRPGAPAAPADPPGPPTDIAALTLGDLAAEPGWRRPVLSDAELVVLFTGGHGTAELDFRPLPCRAGTLLRVRPGQALRCAGPQLDAVVLRWTATALRGLDVDADGVPAYRQLAGADGTAVANEVAQLAADCRRLADGPAVRALLRHQLAVLLLRLTLLAPASAQADPGDADPAGPGGGAGAGRRAESVTFHRLCQEVERRYQHTRRVEDYAARLGCSVRTLTRACLAVTGRSAKQVIDDRVALQARRLLAATDEPIARIGRRLGFPEPTNFGRFFTREVGVSPGVFRAARAGAANGRDAAPTARIVRPRQPTEPAEQPGRA